MQFDISGPLPQDPILLEASAGTGKTWAIAALATRFLAETDLRIDQLACITFTVRAAGELRERVFNRLVSARDALQLLLDDGVQPEEPVEWLLAQADPELRRDRLTRAIDAFDEVMIGTTHEFCQRALKQLGVLGDWGLEEQVLSTPAALIDQCVSDVYLSLYQDAQSAPFSPSAAQRAGRAACESQMPLYPLPAEQLDFVQAVRDRFAARKRQLGLITFDDITSRLVDVVSAPVTGPLAVAALREQYQLVMVDEFQDTDPAQWEVIRRTFIQPGRPTVLIGDPKQSIYGFRSADLACYLEAASQATRLRLGRNHRSDKVVVEGIAELFGTLPLGDDQIRVEEVAVKHEEPRLRMQGMAPSRVWVRRGSEPGVGRDPVAADITRLVHALRENGSIEGRPVSLADIAILVRTGRRGQELLAALQRAGIQATFTGSGSVWATDAVDEWANLLTALADPGRSNVARAAMGNLLGHDLAGLVGDGDAFPRASVEVLALREAFETGGMAAVLARVLTSGLAERVSAQPDGAATLVNLQHVGELLAAAPVQSLTGALGWLAEARLGAADEQGAAARRSSDQPAVRIVTMHAAKGLEFGIVLLPEVSELLSIPSRPFSLSHEGRRHLHVGEKPAADVVQEYERQLREEELRLLYVGLTRARFLAVAWHVRSSRRKFGRSALSALLGRDRATDELRASYGGSRVNGFSPELVSVTEFGDDAVQDRPLPVADVAPSGVATFTREIDQTWRRTSYSGLTASLHALAPAGLVDEPELEVPDAVAPDVAPTLASPMNGLPAGARFGSLVHAALEQLDWQHPDLAAHATGVVGGFASRFGLPADQVGQLAAALVGVCTTPLAGLGDGAPLASFPVSRRLAELDFDLPMGGARPGTVADLARLLERHLPADDPLRAYPARLLATPAADAVLNGFLTGSIDAVLQTPDQRYLVVDYKTNRLPVGQGEELGVEHYREPAMAEAMMASHYPLQAILYSAALHRYLAWRLPDHDPMRDLGGVGYLFVRGMAGPSTPMVAGHACGVFAWHPPAELAVAVSDLLGGKHEA